jgi:hypothetical protein
MIEIMQNLVLMNYLLSFSERQLFNSSAEGHLPFRKEWCKVTESCNKIKDPFICHLFRIENTRKREKFFEFEMT